MSFTVGDDVMFHDRFLPANAPRHGVVVDVHATDKTLPYEVLVDGDPEPWPASERELSVYTWET